MWHRRSATLVGTAGKPSTCARKYRQPSTLKFRRHWVPQSTTPVVAKAISSTSTAATASTGRGRQEPCVDGYGPSIHTPTTTRCPITLRQTTPPLSPPPPPNRSTPHEPFRHHLPADRSRRSSRRHLRRWPRNRPGHRGA